MKISFIKVLITATCFSALFGAQSVLACALGYTCFTDYETGKKGRVQGNNDNWGNFGWDNKADYFYNNGRSMENCLYKGYDQKGKKFLLKRRHALYTSGPYIPYSPVTVSSEWKNVVSSNKWANVSKTSSCPNQ